MSTKSLGELNLSEVTAWLVSISLDKAFGDEFVEQQIDGECLFDVEEGDFDRSGVSYVFRKHD